MSEVKSIEVKDSGPNMFFEVRVAPYSAKSFLETYMDFEPIPYDLMSLLIEDKSIDIRFKADFIYHLGYIEGLCDTLLKARFNNPAGAQLDRPEVVKEFATVMLRFKALYDYYMAGNKVDWVSFHDSLIDIQQDLERVARRALEQLKA